MPALRTLTPGGTATEIGIVESVALQGPRAASGRGDLGGPDGLDSPDVLDLGAAGTERAAARALAPPVVGREESVHR